jgi:hypothetical protein
MPLVNDSRSDDLDFVRSIETQIVATKETRRSDVYLNRSVLRFHDEMGPLFGQ